jgi:hypothetical protein
LKASQVRDQPNLNQIFKSYIGYCDLQALRTSPYYLEGLRKNLFAMIRQLGPPTFFVTLTSAEKLWEPLIKALHSLHSKRLNMLDNFEDLQPTHIAELICTDPITCARYYDHRTSEFRKLIMKDSTFFGEVQDFFFVTEFQNRGSEHDHGLIWIKNAPIYGINTNVEIEAFIDRYISSDVSLLPTKLQNAQQHQHSRTCRKKNKAICRFHYPLPPMWETKILEPLTPNENLSVSIDSFKKQATKIFQSLRDLNINTNLTFQQFLESLEMSEDMYILSLKSQLTKPHIFLKRKPNDIKTNAFNIRVAPLWFANMDTQFVLDPYAAATHCTSYMTKIY